MTAARRKQTVLYERASGPCPNSDHGIRPAEFVFGAGRIRIFAPRAAIDHECVTIAARGKFYGYPPHAVAALADKLRCSGAPIIEIANERNAVGARRDPH